MFNTKNRKFVIKENTISYGLILIVWFKGKGAFFCSNTKKRKYGFKKKATSYALIPRMESMF